MLAIFATCWLAASWHMVITAGFPSSNLVGLAKFLFKLYEPPMGAVCAECVSMHGHHDVHRSILRSMYQQQVGAFCHALLQLTCTLLIWSAGVCCAGT